MQITKSISLVSNYVSSRKRRRQRVSRC